VLKDLKNLMNEFGEIELKLELKLQKMETRNNNYISIMKTCIVNFVMYVFLNKIFDKVFT